VEADSSTPAHSEDLVFDLSSTAGIGNDPLLSNTASDANGSQDAATGAKEWNFATPALQNTAAKPVSDQPLLIPLPPAISAGTCGLAVMAMLVASRRVRRILFA
jgi:hypothetical protein